MTDRFWSKVDKNGSGGCWLWTGALLHGGYGAFWVDETKRAGRAHRLAYEELVGPIPGDLSLDHLCRVPRCVNPAHLDPCTRGENAARSPNAPYWVKARQTHCLRGHAFNDANTAIHNGRRQCRTCSRELARVRRQLRKQTCTSPDEFSKHRRTQEEA